MEYDFKWVSPEEFVRLLKTTQLRTVESTILKDYYNRLIVWDENHNKPVQVAPAESSLLKALV